MSSSEIIPDELCPHVELGAEMAGGFDYNAVGGPLAGMCAECLKKCVDYRRITVDWEDTNQRRHELIEKIYSTGLSADENEEIRELQRLAGLKREMLLGDLPNRQAKCLKPWCGIDGKVCVDCAALTDADADACAVRCSICEGMDHHWLPESDDDINDGEPFMICKHCSAARPMLDSDGDY